MTKRKPRSRAKPRAAPKSGSARNWLLVGAVVAAGWFAFDANRPFVETQVAAIRSTLMPARDDAAPARPAAVRAAATPVRPASPARQVAAAAPETPQPRAGVPAVRSEKEPALPTRRPPAAVASAPSTADAPRIAAARTAPASAGSRKIAKQTPLYREAARTAPVWVVLEAGHSVRVTGRKDGFRRVEAGIFTGWVEAASLEALPPSASAAPTRANPAAPARASAAPAPAPLRAASVHLGIGAATPARAAPMPRGTIPESGR